MISGIRGFIRTAARVLLSVFMVGVSTGCSYTIPSNMTSLLSVVSSLFATIEGVSLNVTNVRDGGTTQSGFLFGTVSGPDLVAVEWAIDSGAYTQATGVDNWSFQLPTGSTGLRLGSTYTVRIRARDSIGAYSSVVSYSIRKGLNKDVNGDGYPDLLVGANIHNSSTGQAYIFYGGTDGITTKGAGQADVILTGEATPSRFGVSTVLADINGDGYADAILGASTYSSNAGRVYVFHSGGSTGITNMTASSADTILTGTAASLFGFRANAGDLNGDGFSDLTVAASLGNIVYTFHSNGASGIPTQSAAAADAIITGPAPGLFGAAVELGDINGDGFADLVVGAPLVSSGDGAAYIFLSSGGALTSRTYTAADTTLTGETGSSFGRFAVLADVNGDQNQDVIVAGYQTAGSDGRVYLFRSAGASGISSGAATSADTIWSGETGQFSRFGAGLAAGDVDGDGNMDILAGADRIDGTSADVGRAYVFYSAGTLGSGNADVLAGSIFTSGTFNMRMGSANALIDLNGDGYDDVLTAAAYETTAVDAVYFFRASAGAMITSQDLGSGGSADAFLSPEIGNDDNFGVSVAR